MARPSAHGQAMMSTATAAVNAKPSGAGAEPEAERRDGDHEDDRDEDAEMRSASRCTGALPDCASLDEPGDLGERVSAPTRVARTIRRPPALMVAPTTGVAGADLDRHGSRR